MATIAADETIEAAVTTEAIETNSNKKIK